MHCKQLFYLQMSDHHTLMMKLMIELTKQANIKVYNSFGTTLSRHQSLFE